MYACLKLFLLKTHDKKMFNRHADGIVCTVKSNPEELLECADSLHKNLIFIRERNDGIPGPHWSQKSKEWQEN